MTLQTNRYCLVERVVERENSVLEKKRAVGYEKKRARGDYLKFSEEEKSLRGQAVVSHYNNAKKTYPVIFLSLTLKQFIDV